MRAPLLFSSMGIIFNRRPGTIYSAIPIMCGCPFPLLDHPATPEDMHRGKAVFSLDGQGPFVSARFPARLWPHGGNRERTTRSLTINGTRQARERRSWAVINRTARFGRRKRVPDRRSLASLLRLCRPLWPGESSGRGDRVSMVFALSMSARQRTAWCRSQSYSTKRLRFAGCRPARVGFGKLATHWCSDSWCATAQPWNGRCHRSWLAATPGCLAMRSPSIPVSAGCIP